MMKKLTFLLCLVFMLLSLRGSEAISSTSLAVQVQDISDRKYEQAVINLLDNAKESIVISMYSINLGTESSNPIKLLLNDLLEARDRGVKVTLFLNTRFRDSDKVQKSFIKSPIYNKLKDAGCEIHHMPTTRRLHDKLIVVDNRYVVEGSTNWSISALKDNFESATLIDSPGLARIKLLRLENLLEISKKTRAERSYTPVYLKNLPKSLSIDKALLLNNNYFSKMITTHDSRSLDLYLLLLAHSQAAGEDEFFVSLEAMALSLGMPDTWTYTALRRQVIKSLKKLQYRYKLIEAEFFYGRDAAIRLLRHPGANVILTPAALLRKAKQQGEESSFNITTNSIINLNNKDLTMRLKYLLLIQALLKSEGKDLNSMSQADLAKRFNVHEATIHAAFRDLKNYNDG